MSLITRIGATNTNSFVSLDQARLILESRYSVSELAEWTALSSDEQEYRLTMAAQIIALMPLRGRRVYKNQALAFPRTLLVPRESAQRILSWGTRYYDTDRVLYGQPDDEWQDETECRRIPDELKEVQCQIAFKVVHPTLASGGGDLGQGPAFVSSISIGGMNVGLKDGGKSGNLFDRIYGATQAFIFIKMQKWISQFRGGAIRAVQDMDFYEPCETLPTTTSTSTTTTSTTVTTTSSTTTTVTAP